MKRIVGMATTAERLRYANLAIESLRDQCDEIHLYNNGVELEDLTDNGKFFGLTYYDEPVYYFSVDDDLIYPSNYIEQLVKEIEETQSIVTHHGRILRGENHDYYRGHYAFHCLSEQPNRCKIDVAGTGVTGWRTDYFDASNIWAAEDKLMSDLVFSLEAAKQEKNIMLMPHRNNWFKYLDVPNTIHEHFMNRSTKRQTEIANEIYTRNVNRNK
jgi:hypothetical protein